jgi:hypothetical protein
VYLVGGGVAFPAVGRVARRFGKLQLAPQPFAATAIGLAIAASASRSSCADDHPALRSLARGRQRHRQGVRFVDR